MLDYLFKDAVAFLSKIVMSYLDERSIRESILQFFKLINVVAPFMIMNDFRIA
jgi:hypothetical protein